MGLRLRSTLAVVVAAAALSAVAPLPAAAFEEAVLRVPVPPEASGGRADEIDVTLFRPDGRGPFPLAVLSHGSPRSASDRRRNGRIRFERQSRALLAMGYAVAVPTRRGYGDSGGEWAEGYGSCAQPDYHAAGLQTARDIVAAVQAARREPGIDASRIVLLGQSAGGWGSIAAASLGIEGLAGVVNFAGGRGSYQPLAVCAEDRLVEAAARFGRDSRVEQLWIYSANDQYFAPPLARRMHQAFVSGGGRAQLHEVPATGRDGHGYFANAVDHWAPVVKQFLQRDAGGQSDPLAPPRAQGQ